MELLPGLVTVELPVAQRSERVQELIGGIRASGQLEVLPLVTALGPFLTSEDDAVRTRAVLLLAEIITALPQLLRSAGDVQHLAAFFTGRLTDWPAIRGALSGCLALLDLPPPQKQQQSQQAGGAGGAEGAGGGGAATAALAPGDAVQMLAAFADHVFVRSLGQQDRSLALRMLCKAMAAHGQAVLDSRQADLVEVVIASLDGEKDPRCLLLGLRCVRAAAELYGRQPEDSLHAQRFEEASEELFDVTAAYFPVSFTPPPNDPHGITRAQLAAELEASLAATPLFAPHLLPLLLEKLGSSLRQAKLDSLSALGACAQAWGFDPLEEDITAVWGALRGELLLGPAGGGLVAGAAGTDPDVAAAAAKCLSRCLEAFAREGHWELLDALWGDAAVQDLFASLQPPTSGGDEEGMGGSAAAFARRVACARAAALVLAAACRAGRAVAARLLSLALPRVLPLCSPPPSSGSSDGVATGAAGARASQCLALSVLLTLLQAAGSGEDGGQQAGEEQPQLPLLPEAFEAALQWLCPGEASGWGQEETGVEAEPFELWAPEQGAYTPHTEALLRLKALSALFSLPGVAAELSPAQLQAAVERLVGCILGTGAAAEPAVQPSGEAAPAAGGSLAGEATATLCKLGSDGQQAQQVVLNALPAVAAAAEGAAGAAARGAALAALQALAGGHPVLRGAVLNTFDGAIQRLLPAAAAQLQPPSVGGSAGPPPPALLAVQLLGAVRTVLLAGGAEGGAAEEAAALAEHLFAVVMALPEAQAPPGGSHADLLGACASTLFHAVSLAAEPAQSSFLASSGCMEQLRQLGAGVAAAAGASAAGQLQLAARSAVLAALRPPVLASSGLTTEQLGELVRALLGQALSPVAAGSDEGAPRWAALAAAALLNKWQPDSPAFHRVVHQVLESRLFPLTIGAPGSPEPEAANALLAAPPTGAPGAGAAHVRRAWACLAQATRALCTRGHPAADGVLAGVLSLLGESAAAAAAGAGAMEAGDAELAAAWPPQQGGLVVREAARLFGEVLAAPEDAVVPSCCPQLSAAAHAVSKPLWQQRFFTLQSAALLRALSAAPLVQAQAPAAEGGVEDAASPSPLLLALAQLLRAAPAAVLQTNWERMLPWVARCLGSLLGWWRSRRAAAAAAAGDGDGDGALAEEEAERRLVLALLGTLCEALMTEQGQRICEGMLEVVVPALRGALQYAPSFQVRERAAQGLLLLVQLPYSALHAYRQRVVKALTAALDDNRRAVRLQAAQAKQAWVL